MGKTEFLDALKRAMTGLAPALQAKTLAYYEQRFVDAAAAGRSEADVARELDDPKKIAMTLRASTHLSAFEHKRNPANLLRLLVSGLGLGIFNLFMVVPALVYASLLASMYACGLAGANELVLDGPLRHALMSEQDADESDTQTRVTIGEDGVRVFQEKVPEPHPAPSAADADADAPEPAIRRAEAVAGRGIHISTSLDAGSRATQTFFGLSMVLGAICLLLLSLVVTKYTVVGLKRYVEMNYSLLKGH
jgi:uncharacterized membrane protein